MPRDEAQPNAPMPPVPTPAGPAHSDSSPSANDRLPHQQRRARRPFSSARLNRSRDKRLLGGVLQGIGEFVNADPTFIRIAFAASVLISAGVMIAVYVVLWLLIPAAE